MSHTNRLQLPAKISSRLMCQLRCLNQNKILLKITNAATEESVQVLLLSKLKEILQLVRSSANDQLIMKGRVKQRINFKEE